MSLTLVVCRARNGTIGRDGTMPWRMPSDLAHFKATTIAKPVIMGRKTYQSIGRPLPGRLNIVVTRAGIEAPDGVLTAPDLPAAVARARAAGHTDLMILGGGEIYRAALPFADRVIMTELAADIDGDTVFPDLDPAVWTCVSRTPLATTPRDDYAAEVCMFERKDAKDTHGR
jgi:dihydrofolate reductase